MSISRVRGDDPPADARSSLYVHATRIRRLLAQAASADGVLGQHEDAIRCLQQAIEIRSRLDDTVGMASTSSATRTLRACARAFAKRRDGAFGVPSRPSVTSGPT